MSASRLLKQGQNWLIQRMQKLGYKSSLHGVCEGIAHMAKQAILTDDMDTFNQRLQLINDIPLERFSTVVNTAIRKTPKTPQDELIASIPAFFEGIELYNQANLYPDLFEPEKSPKTQTDFCITPRAEYSNLVASAKLENAGSSSLCGSFLGIYNDDLLKNTLIVLKNSVLSNVTPAMNPIAFTLTSTDHTITIGYNPRNDRWYFIDANRLSTQNVTEFDRLTDQILHSFSENKIAPIFTQIHALATDKILLADLISNLKANPHWLTLHKITVARASLTNSRRGTLLHLAATIGDLDTVKALLAQGANANSSHLPRRNTPLFNASQEGHHEIVKVLVENGAEVNNSQIKDGTTPLHIAAEYGHTETVKVLLELSANVNTHIPSSGATPLFLAAMNGNVEIVNALLEKGSDVNLALTSGATPLFIAAQNGHHEIVAILMRHGADAQQSYIKSAEGLRSFAKNKSTAVQNKMNLFIEAKQKMGEPESAITMTPWQIACILNNEDVSACLRKHGAAPADLDETIIDELNKRLLSSESSSGHTAPSSSFTLFNSTDTHQDNTAEDVRFMYLCFGELDVSLTPSSSISTDKPGP